MFNQQIKYINGIPTIVYQTLSGEYETIEGTKYRAVDILQTNLVKVESES